MVALLFRSPCYSGHLCQFTRVTLLEGSAVSIGLFTCYRQNTSSNWVKSIKETA